MTNETNIWQKFIWLSERTILMIIAVATLFATGIEIYRLIDEKPSILVICSYYLFMLRSLEWLELSM